LNWNGWEETLRCLAAVEECTYPRLTIVVVDNGSTDDSVARIRAAAPKAQVLESGKNLGFAGGNNVGIRYAMAHGAEYVWLLNNDTLPAPAAFSALLAKALADEGLGAVASVCYYAHAPSTVQVWAGARVNLWIGRSRNSTEPREDTWFDALYGASMLVRRGVLEDVGLLDEGFFFYWEETEFCLRARQQGWRLAAAPESRVLHKVHASTGKQNPVLDRYFTTSGLRLLKLHSPAPGSAMCLFITARFVRRLLRWDLLRCRSVWMGILDYRDTLPIVRRTQ